MIEIHRESISWIGGLRVRSNRALLDHSEVGFDAWDVHLVFGADDQSGTPFGATVSDSSDWLAVPPEEGVKARVRVNGREAWVEEPKGEPIDYSLQARRVIPFAAALQGRLILHAGAVVRAGGVHAFIGESGAGKSTLVQALGAVGFLEVSDDLLPCRLEEGGVSIPSINMDPEEASTRLDGIHFLERKPGLDKVRHSRLEPAETLRRLIRHGFGELGLPRVWALQFESYGQVAEVCPAFVLEIPEGLQHLPRVAGELKALLSPDSLRDPSGQVR